MFKNSIFWDLSIPSKDIDDYWGRHINRILVDHGLDGYFNADLSQYYINLHI